MTGKDIFLKVLWLLSRLAFHTFAFIVIYFVVRDNLFLKLNYKTLSYSFTIDQAWAGGQIAFWMLTIPLESVTTKMMTIWSQAQFQANRKKIKSAMQLYTIVILVMAFSTVDCYRFPDEHIIIKANYDTSDPDLTQLIFVLYCVESAISILVCIYAKIAFKRRDDPHGYARNGQRILQHLLEEAENQQAQQRLQQQQQQQQQVQQQQEQQRRQQQHQAPNEPPAPPAPSINQQRPAAQQQPSAAVNRFDLRYSIQGESAQIEYNRECPICLEDIKPEERIIELPCLHSFHSACIRSCTNRLCPLCRVPY